MKKQKKIYRILGGMLAGLFVLILFIMAANFEYTRAVEAKKRAVSDSLNVLTADLSGIIQSYVFVGNGVRYYINLTPNFKDSEINKLVDGLTGENRDLVSNFALLKDTTISYVYPYESNKSALGTDLSKIPDQKEPIEAVKRTGQTFITGPVNLIEGGKGIILRMIIHAGGADGKAYWGQVAEVLSYEKITRRAKIDTYFNQNYLRIYEENVAEKGVHMLWSNHSDPMKIPVIKEIDLGQSKWIIEAVPKDGWTGRTTSFYLLIFLGIIASGSTGLLVFGAIGKREQLALKVHEKTEALEASLGELKAAQDQLIEQEKMASLGVLVSGVAHEINTPLGVGISTASYLEDLRRRSTEHLAENKLTKEEFVGFLTDLENGFKILNMNLFRAAELVKNFKQVAVDQHGENLAEFSVGEYIDMVVKTLSHESKKAGVQIRIRGEGTLWITSFPGAFSQILTNLIMNSYTHGFKGRNGGRIDINYKMDGNILTLHYQDDGNGIHSEVLPKIFDPFFTTDRQSGGSGLGLHIVYNIISGKFHGKIRCESEPENGVLFTISIPLQERDGKWYTES